MCARTRSVVSNSLQSSSILIKTKMSYMTQVSFFGNLHFWAMSWVCKRWLISDHLMNCWTSLVAQTVKTLPAIQETQVQSLGWEDAQKKGIDYPLQYSCLKNSMNRGAWWAAVHGGHKESDGTEQLTLFSELLKSYVSVSRIIFLPLTCPSGQLAWAAGGGEARPPWGAAKQRWV